MRPVARLSRSLAAGAVLALALATPAVAADDVKVVASGLDNPRGIDTGPGGYLYVAESGRGGTGACSTNEQGEEVCFGTTGAVTRVKPDGDKQSRITTGLPSIAGPDGSFAIGPAGVSWPRRGIRDLGFLTIGLEANPARRAELPPEARRWRPSNGCTPTAATGRWPTSGRSRLPTTRRRTSRPTRSTRTRTACTR